VVTVSGTGSNWTNSGDVYVGYSGSGTLNITGGAAVSNNNYSYCHIGYDSGSTGVVTVNGAGSTWNSGYLYVGYYGSGTLNITGGGAVSTNSDNCYIGYNSDMTGVV